MTDPARLSDMIGIRKEIPQSEAVWPLNLVLLVLGGAILAVAFAFLDVADTRLLYNPWTYAIATPIGLMGFSALLSTVVSQVVEKSMQLAFLLSVLIHLILMVCATNVIIFSRVWPDVLDSLDQQREYLKRERLQAKQYHRIAITKQAGGRPDYLKPVATQHQPTETEPSTNPTLALARSDRANLISPSPQVELSHSPSLLQRDQVVTTLPLPSESAAALSRSTVTVPKVIAGVIASQPPLEYQLVEPLQPTPMAPAPATLARQSRSQQSALAEAPALAMEPATAPSSVIARSEQSSPAEPQSPTQIPAELERRTVADLQPKARPASEIATPDFSLQGNPAQSTLAQGQLSQPQMTPSAAAVAARRGMSSQSAAMSATTPPAAPELASPLNALAQLSPSRAASALAPLSAPSSDSRVDMPRSTAGGRLGAAAPSSMPVQGLDNLGLNQPTPQAAPRIASAVPLDRRTPSQSAASQLPMSGIIAAPTWEGVPSLAGGQAGKSPSQLARSAADGDGASEDVAGLSGADRDLERSALSRPGQPSPTAVQGLNGLLSQSSGAVDLSGENPAPLAAAGAGLARSTQADAAWKRGNLGPSPTTPPPPSSGLTQSQTTGPRAATPSRLTDEASSSSDSLQPAAIPKHSSWAATTPGVSRIELPDIAATLDSARSAADLAPVPMEADLARRADAAARETAAELLPTNLLTVEAAEGAGGLADVSGLLAGLLGRRDSEVTNWSPPQLEAQRFARQDVGGKLAAGQQVALPKPAFQQRIDRLKERQPQIDSILQPQTELAIERGLEYLAKHQRPDGSWRLQDFDTPVLMRSDTAATGLALLAFQGAGYTHNQFKYAATVEKALYFLVQHQSPSGDLYIPQDPASDQNAWLYSHAIASLALCEAVGMTQDDRLRPAAQRAIDFMVASQDPRRGGWRYRPGVGADTSVTGWFTMAFKSGQLAGLKVPQQSLQAIERFLVASQSPDGESHLFRYNPYAADTPQQRHGLQPTSVMTSVGLLMRLYFGWQRERPEMRSGADYLLQHLPEHGSPSVSRRDTYYWYYATQVMFHMRGQHWQQWHDRLYPLLINSQITEGEHSGSWDPDYPTPDLWARYGGRLYVTTLNLLSLEVSYRHLPLYEATGQ